MSLQPLIPVLVLLLSASVAGMTWAASHGAQLASLAAAVAFGLAVAAAALYINRPASWRRDSLADAAVEVHASRRNARLMALVYAWGGFALLAVYQLSGLKWQHGWQYGAGMALIAAGLLLHVHRLGDSGYFARSRGALVWSARLAMAQAVAIAVGLGWLVAVGKLTAGKADWAANHVFLVGGAALFAVSVMAYRTHTALAALSRKALA